MQTHAEKVDGVFRTLEHKFTTTLNDEENRLLEAIVRFDPDGVQRVLDEIQAAENWFEGEFIKHPKIAEMIEQLSIMGL